MTTTHRKPKMNKRTILKVAKAIETAAKRKEGLRGVGFNMDSYIADADEVRCDHVDSCGTVSCIAGWTCLVAGGLNDADSLREIEATQSVYAIPRRAAEILGIDFETRYDLFTPHGAGPWASITPAHAVAVLRHLAETGVVDWSVGASR